jgi:hypothetical protein
MGVLIEGRAEDVDFDTWSSLFNENVRLIEPSILSAKRSKKT